MTNKRYAVVGLFGAVATVGAGAFVAPASASTKVPTTKQPAPGSQLVEVEFGSAAACVGRNAVSTHEVFVDGVSVGWNLEPKVLIQGGSSVKVAFTVAQGCDPTQFGLAIYSDPVGNPNPTREDVNKQTFATSAVVTKSAGEMGTLEIALPAIDDCFYQVDFFQGPVIQSFGPSDSNNYYGGPPDRLISAKHIAKPNCVEVLETTTTVRPTTTSSTSTTSSTTSTIPGEEVLPNETESGRPEVLGEVINGTTTSTTEQPAEVLAENLAATGTNEAALIGLASAFAAAGGALKVASNALRRRRTTNSTR